MLHLIATGLLALSPLSHPDHPTERAPLPDIVETAVAAGDFDTLATALTTAGLVETLQGDGPFTVFAPTDAAFAAIPAETLQALLRPENRDQLVRVLKLHVVTGEVSGVEALKAGEAHTLAGETLPIRLEGGRLRVGAAGVQANDVQASNGVIHVIDAVLLPADGLDLRPAGRLVIGVYIDRPSAALAAQLGIDRDAAQLVDDVTSNGNAKAAGLQPYDVIVSIDGEPAVKGRLDQAKQRAGAGGTIDLGILRQGRSLTLHVPVGVERH